MTRHPKEEYQGVRCTCIQTGCRAGPGCPHYNVHCRAHITHRAWVSVDAQPLIPPGFGVAHHSPSALLTDEANAEGRYTVHRIEPPYVDRRRNRSWQGPTLEVAVARACEALEIDRQAT